MIGCACSGFEDEGCEGGTGPTMMGRQTDVGNAEKGADAEADTAHVEAPGEGAGAGVEGVVCSAGGTVEVSLVSTAGSVLTLGIDEKGVARGAVVNGLVCTRKLLDFGVDVNGGGRGTPLMSPLTLRFSAGSRGAGFSFFLPFPSLPPVLDDAA